MRLLFEEHDSTHSMLSEHAKKICHSAIVIGYSAN
jgi:hypothetical protein